MSEEIRSPSPPTSRAFAVLEAFAECPTGGMSLSQVARAVGLSTSTTASILAAMDESGYVERLPDRTYRLGPGLLKLFGALRSRYPLLGAADEELGRLSAAADCGCSLARVTPDSLEVILTVGSVEEFLTRAGHRLPHYPPFGCVAMAWQSPQRIDEWLLDSPDPLSAEETGALRRALAEIHECRYAVYNVRRDVQTMVPQMRRLLSLADEHTPADALHQLILSTMTGAGIYSGADLAQRRRRPVSYVIAPVFGADQQPHYLLSLHVMRDAVSAEDLDRYVTELQSAAAALTAAAGAQWPSPGATSFIEP